LQESKPQRLTSITRLDLSEGYQSVQSAHALIDFIFEHPTRAGPWHNSNYLEQRVCSNEKELRLLIRKCEELGLAYTVFREPDIGNQITAIAIEPSKETEKLVRKLPRLLDKDKIKQHETRKNSPKNYGHQSKSLQSNQN
jgi:hypothetical protein